METEKQSATMVDLIELGRQFEWHCAIEHWFECGRLERIVALLRENRPMTDAEARFVAAIFAGEERHWGAGGGPSNTKQRQTHSRNAILVRPLFEQVLKIKKWQAKRHPEKRIDARSEALEYVSVFFRDELSPDAVKKRKLSPDAVKKIVEEPKARYFYGMPVDAKAALAARWEKFKKKPDEVL